MNRSHSELPPEPVFHSRDSVIIVIEGGEDTTVRPLRPDIPLSWFEVPVWKPSLPKSQQPPSGQPPAPEKS